MVQTSQSQSERWAVFGWLLVIAIVAELLRVGTAVWLVERNRRNGVEHEFADSELYWKLALNIAAGRPYDDGKRQVLRTPGYPLFLAGCIRLLGDRPTGARHAQAAVGAASCLLLYVLVRKLVGERAAWGAAAAAAVYPFAVLLSAVLLSECLFTCVLLLQLIYTSELCAQLRRPQSIGRILHASSLTGILAALATLVRPSWLLVVPALACLSPIVACTGNGALGETRRRQFIRSLLASGTMLLAASLTLSPWWLRNWHVTGHFVPTTLWVGASLYDGWNERANGASNMEFMNHPESYGLTANLNGMNEWDQDQYLRGEAWQFARTRPLRVLELAAIKFVRFWNPLPNAAEWRSGLLRIVSLLACGPVLALSAVGAWRLRRDWVTVLILAGPVVYFSAIHLVFASSVRYREAAMLPVLGLAAAAIVRPRQQIELSAARDA